MPPLRNDPDFRKRGDSGGDAPGLVAGEELGRRAHGASAAISGAARAVYARSSFRRSSSASLAMLAAMRRASSTSRVTR
jgi:hypothetical protein